jgi:hypothetical protein
VLNLSERIRASPYYPALVHPVFRRVLPGAAASALGDGMSAVAIAWLALKLAPAGSRGLWVGAAVAAYTLPGAVGAIVLRRWLRGRHGAALVIVNAVLRGAALGLAGCLALAGLLGLPAYVALLGASSLLTAWGVAGKYTLIADLFPADQRVAGNTVFSLADQLSLMIGPVLAGVITALAGPRPHPRPDQDPDPRSPGSVPRRTARLIGWKCLSLTYLNIILNKRFNGACGLFPGCRDGLVDDRISNM